MSDISNTTDELEREHDEKEAPPSADESVAEGTNLIQALIAAEKELQRAREEAQKNFEGWQNANKVIDELKAEVKKLNAKSLNYQKQADFVSFQKIKSFLPVIDDFNRAFINVPEDISENQWFQGVSMIRQNFEKALLDETFLDKIQQDTTQLAKTLRDKIQQDTTQLAEILRDKTFLDKIKIEEIDPTGEPFDPNFHQAIGIDDSDKVESGHVTVTLQKGYRAGEIVLRLALVRVAS